MTKSKEKGAVTEAMVSEYLRNNPDFFNRQSALVAELNIPHEHGASLSLVEKQLAVLRQQNRESRRHLSELIETVRRNEALAVRVHHLVLSLIEAGELKTIFETVYESLKENFQADRAVIRLFAEPVAADALMKEFVDDDSMQALFKGFIEKRLPSSGQIQRWQQDFLFGDKLVASAVMVPLYGDGWEGILAIGSFDAARFQPSMGVELLGNLGEVLSLLLKPRIKQACPGPRTDMD